MFPARTSSQGKNCSLYAVWTSHFSSCPLPLTFPVHTGGRAWLHPLDTSLRGRVRLLLGAPGLSLFQSGQVPSPSRSWPSSRPLLYSTQFVEASPTSRVQNWTRYPLASIAAMACCCSWSFTAYQDPAELLPGQAAAACTTAREEPSTTTSPSSLRCSSIGILKLTKRPQNCTKSFQGLSNSKNKYFWFILTKLSKKKWNIQGSLNNNTNRK